MNYIEFDLPEKFKGEEIEEFEPKKAEEFFKWFLSIKDERVKILERAVQNTPGFEDWKADYTPQSLNGLQEWFEPQIEERTFSDEELDSQKNVYKGTVLEKVMKDSVPAVWTLTGRTIRLAVDSGIYFSEVFLHNNPSLKWGQNTTSKLYVYKNYPLVQGFVGADLSPFFIVRNNAITLHKRGEKTTWEDIYKERLQYIKTNN